MRNLFSTKVKIILVVAALLTAALAIYSGISNQSRGHHPDQHGGKILQLYVPLRGS